MWLLQEQRRIYFTVGQNQRGDNMNKENYVRMRMIMLNLAEWLNTPNDELEDMMGINWMQFHDLITSLRGEEYE